MYADFHSLTHKIEYYGMQKACRNGVMVANCLITGNVLDI